MFGYFEQLYDVFAENKNKTVEKNLIEQTSVGQNN